MVMDVFVLGGIVELGPLEMEIFGGGCGELGMV